METKQNHTPELDGTVENAQQEISGEEIREGLAEAADSVEGQPSQEEGAQEQPSEEQPSQEQPIPEQGGPVQPKKKNPVGKALGSSRFKRGGMATLMSVVFIAIIVVVNILVSVLTERFPSMNIDLTANKTNTLSDQALEIAKGVDKETEIYLIGAEESYRKNRLYSNYGLEYSQVANLSEKLREANSKISVSFIDPDTNPKFISDYSEESLTSGSVLVRTEKRYKVLHASDLFNLQTNQQTYQYDTYSKVDSALAGALEAVNLDKVPVVTIATGHGEMLTSDDLGAFQEMLESLNFEIREIDFLTEEIPEDTQLLMLPTPTTDYTEEEVEKLRAYLDDETRAEQVTLLVTCHTTQGDLPRLQAFLEEWGIQLEEGMVAETDASRMALGSAAYVMVDANTEEVFSDKSYSNLVAAASRPLTVLFKGNGDVATQPLWTTSEGAYVVTESTAEEQPSETAQQTVAAIGAKFIRVDGEDLRRSVVVFGSSFVFTDTFLQSAFGDKAYLSDLMQYSTGTDGSAVSVLPQQVQTNKVDVTASANTVNLLGLGVFTIGLPLAILIIGLVIFLRRRHL